MQKRTLPVDPPVARAMRDALVRELVADGDLGTPGVVEALREIPRHAFMPHASLSAAYANRATPIGHEQTISQPAIVAMMTEALELTGTERVLEVGTGSGYQAAVLARLAAAVFTIERIAELAHDAAARLERLGFTNVRVRCGDGYLGWVEHAPFDRIMLTAAPPRLPRAVVAQLADGGVLVAPIGDADALGQSLVRVRKHGGAIDIEDLAAVAFVEMLPGE